MPFTNCFLLIPRLYFIFYIMLPESFTNYVFFGAAVGIPGLMRPFIGDCLGAACTIFAPAFLAKLF